MPESTFKSNRYILCSLPVRSPADLPTDYPLIPHPAIQQYNRLHAKYVAGILKEATIRLKRLPNLNQASTAISKQVTICGDLHGKLDDLLVVFHKVSESMMWNGTRKMFCKLLWHVEKSRERKKNILQIKTEQRNRKPTGLFPRRNTFGGKNSNFLKYQHPIERGSKSLDSLSRQINIDFWLFSFANFFFSLHWQRNYQM